MNFVSRGANKGIYKITTLKTQYNHDVIKENYLIYPSNRKLRSELKESAIEMLETGSKAAEIALLIFKKSGKILIAKDIRNLNHVPMREKRLFN